MLHLYSDSSPNGFKATIALEELSLPYQLHHVRIDEGEHRQSAFLALNPHGRIPVGRSLIMGVAAKAQERGWPVVRWITAGSNAQARQLYDKLASATDWVTYAVDVQR